jgi:ABC-type lipoprotein release transport system permease subunit
MLLIVQSMRERLLRKEEIGLLRALGWETSHLVRLHLTRAGLVAVPFLVAGMLIGYGLIFGTNVAWPSKLLLGWSGPAPVLALDTAGALQALAAIGAMILLPYLAAAAAPVLWAALADPQDLLEKGR